MNIKGPKQQILDVYLQNQLVGKLCSNNATLSFNYTSDYLKKFNSVKLSVALPLQENTFDHQSTYAFFSGLLPDEGVRQRLAKHIGLSEKNIFALLKAIGGECAGAVSVYSQGVSPILKGKAMYRILNDIESDHILSALNKHPLLAGELDIRMSAAGAQDKLMIAFVNGQIGIPIKNSPSTHIIKPEIKGLEASVQNEYFCMRLAKMLGLPVPEVEIYWLKEKPYYLIERYDRRQTKKGSIIRLHQEDFCQALHIPPEIKYESEGGPTLAQTFALLDNRIKLGFMEGKNKIILLQGIIFNFLIGNGDAHAKNFSLLYSDNFESLAPFYDLLSTVIYSSPFKAKMAMQISGKYKFKEVCLRHWENLSSIIGFRPDFIKKQLILLSQSIPEAAIALASELNQSPKTASPIYDKIIAVIFRNQKQLFANL